MHFIPGNVVFTEPVYNDQSFTNGNIQEQVTFHKDSAGGGKFGLVFLLLFVS